MSRPGPDRNRGGEGCRGTSADGECPKTRSNLRHWYRFPHCRLRDHSRSRAADTAGLSCSLHFVILTLGRQPEFTALPWLPLFVEFRWPSVVYALDILAWDVFFPPSVLAAAPVFRGGRLASWIRVLMIISGILALGGLTGVMTGDMQLRNIGIVGYAGVFPVAAALLALLFHRTVPYEPLQPPKYPTN